MNDLMVGQAALLAENCDSLSFAAPSSVGVGSAFGIRSSPYARDEYQALLMQHHAVCRMSRKGSDGDDA
ncbi:hypothetical protein PQR02_35085 [Paraburkholderia sediminicola]|uniref:Uncharacterized protein n=1 Tax=Paraburkholderia rhynchosiae TaxID=487049 RepID=A0ACC7NLE5_9BURK